MHPCSRVDGGGMVTCSRRSSLNMRHLYGRRPSLPVVPDTAVDAAIFEDSTLQTHSAYPL